MKSITRILFILTIFTGFSSTVVWSKTYGPSSIGNLEIGIDKNKIESFGKESPIYMTQKLSCKTIDSGEVCETKFMTPFAKIDFEGSINFDKSGKADYFLIDFGGAKYVYNNVIKTIKNKYGSPDIEDQMSKKICSYRTGNQFEFDNGVTYSRWRQEDGDNYIVLSGAYQSVVFCPLSIKYSTPSPSSYYYISLKTEKKEDVSVKNIF